MLPPASSNSEITGKDLSQYLPSIGARIKNNQMTKVAEGNPIRAENEYIYTVGQSDLRTDSPNEAFVSVNIDLTTALIGSGSVLQMTDYDFVLLTQNSATKQAHMSEPYGVILDGDNKDFPVVLNSEDHSITLLFEVPKGSDSFLFLDTNFINDKAAGPVYVTSLNPSNN